MSKKRKRRRVVCPNNKAEDRHHLCYMGKRWKHGYCKALRNHWYMIIKIPKNTLHSYIHHCLQNIPPPKDNGAKEAYATLFTLERMGEIRETDSIERRLTLLIALFNLSDPLTADAFKKQLSIVRQFYSKPP